MTAAAMPGGEPAACPICGRPAAVEASDPPGDAVCPHCGSPRLIDRLRRERGE